MPTPLGTELRCSFHHNVAKPLSNTVKAVAQVFMLAPCFMLCFFGLAGRQANSSTMSFEVRPDMQARCTACRVRVCPTKKAIL